MTDHIVEDHEQQYYRTIEDHVKDHSNGQHVTSDQHTILVEQQQPGDLGSQHEDIT